MSILPRLFGLLLLGLLAGLVLLGTAGCNATKPNADRPDPSTGRSEAAPDLRGATGTRQIMQLDGTGKMDYRTARSVIAASLTRQFHDGTTIDRVSVRPAPLDDTTGHARPPYYLIGIGLKDGHYRAIALPLRGTDDGTYSLTPNADRYVITGTGCPNCFFDFEGGRIVGTSCDDGSTGGNCDLEIFPANQVFATQ